MCFVQGVGQAQPVVRSVDQADFIQVRIGRDEHLFSGLVTRAHGEMDKVSYRGKIAS